jgi:hypothetical protein
MVNLRGCKGVSVPGEGLASPVPNGPGRNAAEKPGDLRRKYRWKGTEPTSRPREDRPMLILILLLLLALLVLVPRGPKPPYAPW